MGISEPERRRRQADSEQIRHSIRMEGGETSEGAKRIEDAYVRGDIGIEEAVRRTRALHGLKPGGA